MTIVFGYGFAVTPLHLVSAYSSLINDGYKNIAWLDADILFQDGFWVKDAVDCLNNYKLCVINGKVKYNLVFLSHG